MAQRFMDQLLEKSMIMRVIVESIHLATQEAGHFIVCNYETYNQARATDRATNRATSWAQIKERLKESKKEE